MDKPKIQQKRGKNSAMTRKNTVLSFRKGTGAEKNGAKAGIKESAGRLKTYPSEKKYFQVNQDLCPMIGWRRRPRQGG